MVRLNHTTIVDNKPVTPFLIQGTNVYCFDKKKETIILPLNSFKARKAKKAPVVPVPTLNRMITPEPVLVAPPKPKPVPDPEPVEEKIIIKPKMIHAEITGGSIRTIGFADYTYTKVKEKVVAITESDKPIVYNYEPFGFIKVFGTSDYKHKVFKEYIKEYEGIGIVQAIGLANSKVAVKAIEVPPPVIDNSRYIRPTMDDDYI